MSIDRPTREMDDPGAPSALRSALHSARQAGPGPARLARTREATLQRMAQELSAGTTAGLGAAGLATRTSTGVGASGATRSLGWLSSGTAKLVLWSAALSMWGVATWLWWSAQDAPAHVPEPVAQPAARVVDAPRPAPTPRFELEVDEEPAPSPEVEHAASPEVEAAPPEPRRTRQAPQRQRRARRARPAPPPTQPASHDAPDEITLLSQARAALQDRPAETLRLTDEHARAYPEGTFVQEREVLAVHALLRRGAREAALVRGQRFLTAYPASTHARRVRTLLEEARR